MNKGQSKIDYLITFVSTHLAIETEEILNEKQQLAKIISIPASISAGCGLGLKMTERQYQEAKNQFPIESLEGATVYRKQENAEYQVIDQIKTKN